MLLFALGDLIFTKLPSKRHLELSKRSPTAADQDFEATFPECSNRDVPPDILGAMPIRVGERPVVVLQTLVIIGAVPVGVGEGAVVVLEVLVAVHAGHAGAEVAAAAAGPAPMTRATVAVA